MESSVGQVFDKGNYISYIIQAKPYTSSANIYNFNTKAGSRPKHYYISSPVIVLFTAEKFAVLFWTINEPKLRTFFPTSYSSPPLQRDALISYSVSHMFCVKNMFHKTSRRMANVFTLQRPTYSHQAGLQNKSCFHVRRSLSGLF